MFHFTVGFLIAGGKVPLPTNSTEVVQLDKTNITPSFEQLPSARVGAVGAMLGNVPILCGGNNGSSYLDSCISFQNKTWNQSHSMNEKRMSAAGVQVNSTTFWILGGYNGSHYSKSTEFIIEGQTNRVLGPELPYRSKLMCAVKWSEQEIFVIGGFDGELLDYSNAVWLYNPQNGFARTQVSSLNTKRAGHSCSTMRNGENDFIILAGGHNGPYDDNRFDSVEIYDPTSNTWYSGKAASLFYVVDKILDIFTLQAHHCPMLLH